MALVNSGRIAVSGLLAWDTLTPDSGTSLQIGKVEVSNDNGANMEIGWGEEIPIVVGKVVGGVFTELTLPYTFAAGELLAIVGNKKFDALEVTVDTAAAGAVTLGVYNGTNLTTLSVSADVGALTFNGVTPDVAAITNPINGWVQGGITGQATKWCMVSTDAQDLEISAVRAGRVIDFVSTVADGNHAFREYSLEPLLIGKNEGLFVYTSDAAQTTSIATIDYQQI